MKISLIFGTRPEAIKLCPLILQMQRHSRLRPHVCVTAQHRQMLDQVLCAFDVAPDADLNLMQPNQSLAGLTSRAVTALDGYLAAERPDMVIVQGDTTTVLCAALCAYYHRIPIGHVEAGLRTGNKFAPFPEEINRVLTSHLGDLHFAPTQTAKNNLLSEGVPEVRIHVTGNTVIDALLIAVERIRRSPPFIPGLPRGLQPAANGNGASAPRIVLITGHRRENFGEGFESICRAIAKLAGCFPDVHFVYPVHANPNVREPVFRMLGHAANIHLIEPLSYLPFVALMDRSAVVLTDSGGVQEEAPSLGKPVLVMRETTERPEAVALGAVRMVGTHADAVVAGISELLTSADAYGKMARAVNPYGDGKASGRIISAIESRLSSAGLST
jgi:UDP-N-acetylglucosamine 2-epimerase (non-hydrolysing)